MFANRLSTVPSRCHRGLSSLRRFVDVTPEVQDALAHGRPVVALETTIVTHGMPYPTNRETAKSVENNVRKAGAIPATIGLIEGRVKIGLEPHELERLADVSKNTSVVKLSRRDLGAAIALKRDGVSDHTSCILNVWVRQLYEGHDLQYHSYVRCVSWH